MYTRDTQRQYQRKHYTQLDQRQKGQVTLKNEHQWQTVKASVLNTTCFNSITRRRVMLLCTHETHNANTRALPAPSTRSTAERSDYSAQTRHTDTPIHEHYLLLQLGQQQKGQVTLYSRDTQRQYQNTTCSVNSVKGKKGRRLLWKMYIMQWQT